MQDFRSLKGWQKAHALTLTIYEASRQLPSGERFGLTSQMRRGAASIATNIAEGCGRGSDPDFARFLQMAMGSASELEYLPLLAHDLRHLTEETYQQLDTATKEVKRMLASLLKKLKADS